MASPAQLAALAAVVPAAQASQAKWGVPASVTLAQWALESSWGQSQLSLKAKNFFGIKAIHLNAPETYEEFPTAEYVSGKRVMIEALFEKFPDEAACFEAHARLLATAARYRPAMAMHTSGTFALALQKAGYSTSSAYAAGLIKLISQHNLTQYDTPPPAAAQEVAAA